jgi:hypothetical protein
MCLQSLGWKQHPAAGITTDHSLLASRQISSLLLPPPLRLGLSRNLLILVLRNMKREKEEYETSTSSNNSETYCHFMFIYVAVTNLYCTVGRPYSNVQYLLASFSKSIFLNEPCFYKGSVLDTCPIAL